MHPSKNPFAVINLHGGGTSRGVTLELPSETVRDLLPAGLELGPQDVTRPGYHPVILFFHDLFRAQMSIPTLLPSMTYFEHSIGVPFSYLSRESITPGYPGPYYFMPRLYLDHPLPAMGGALFWGFTKQVASIQVTAERYTISNFAGQRLTSLSWKREDSREEEHGAHQPVAKCQDFFHRILPMLQQPLISLVPAAIGPFFIVSDFDRDWEVATIRPLHTVLEVDVEFVTGYPAGRYPESEDWSKSINEDRFGSYELRAPWRLSLPYPPLLSFRSRPA